jgi:hypothetical protein
VDSFVAKLLQNGRNVMYIISITFWYTIRVSSSEVSLLSSLMSMHLQLNSVHISLRKTGEFWNIVSYCSSLWLNWRVYTTLGQVNKIRSVNRIGGSLDIVKNYSEIIETYTTWTKYIDTLRRPSSIIIMEAVAVTLLPYIDAPTPRF